MTAAPPCSIPSHPRACRRPWASDDAPPDGEPERSESKARPESIAKARSNITTTRNGDDPTPPPTGPDPDADAHRDDPASDDNGLDSTELLQRELGATVIEEIPHD